MRGRVGGALRGSVPAGNGPEPDSFGIACVCAERSTMPLIEVVDGVAEMWTDRKQGHSTRGPRRRVLRGRRTAAMVGVGSLEEAQKIAGRRRDYVEDRGMARQGG
jgi:hypothetical protein